MNLVQNNPPITFGVIAGILVAAWDVFTKNGLLDGLSQEGANAITTLVLLLIPVIAGVVVQRWFTTALANPNLPIGTVVNANIDEPTGKVVPVDQ